jgi:hypothetical protein
VGEGRTGKDADIAEELDAERVDVTGAEVLVVGTGLAVFCGVTGANVFVGGTRVGAGLAVLVGSGRFVVGLDNSCGL